MKMSINDVAPRKVGGNLSIRASGIRGYHITAIRPV